MAVVSNEIPPTTRLFPSRTDISPVESFSQWSSRSPPHGTCHYIELSAGAKAPRCGCQRFWGRTIDRTIVRSDVTEAFSCMCGHHACFHSPSGSARHPKTARADNSPALHPAASGASWTMGKGLGINDWSRMSAVESSSRTHDIWEALAGEGKSQPLANTTGLPSLPSQCVMDPRQYQSMDNEPEHESSGMPQATLRSTVARQPNGMTEERILEPELDSYRRTADQCIQDLVQSATELNTRARSASPDSKTDGCLARTPKDPCQRVPAIDFDGGEIRPGQIVRHSLTVFNTNRDNPSQTSRDCRGDDKTSRSLIARIGMHSQRLDALESASFSNGPIEDLTEKLDLLDGRMTEIESKFDAFEAWRCAVEDEDGSRHRSFPQSKPDAKMNESSCNSSPSDRDLKSTSPSDPPGSLRTTVLPMGSGGSSHCRAMLARLATMTAEFEPRLLELEATAPPSQLRPWQFEVVLLPWGRALHGIWCGADQFSTSHSVSLPAMEEWTQEPDVGGSFSKSVSSGAEYGGWDDADIRRWADNTEEWRSARACGPKSKVFRRLSSRGFVRTVQITDGSAATVRAAIVEAFGHLLKPSTKNTYRQGMTDASSRLPAEADRTRVLGLEAPFVPLRKIHKQSRLRHLHISEMMTSALWTADFLASRVVMKGLEGRKTLFITSVDAYLQYDRDEGAGWTWSKLKQLPMVDVESSNNVSKRGEACWDWDQKLDRTTEAEPQSWLDRNLRPAHTLQPEVNSHGEHSSQGLSSLPTSHSLFDPSSSSEPSFGGMHCTHRHASMPHMSVMEETAPSYKRRVASQDTSLPRETSSKRRRVSPSSALDAFQQGIFDTPIPCRDDPPSPFFSEAAPGESRSQGTNPKRAGTPFAYATPHSGTVALERKVSWDQQRGLDSDEEMRLLASNDDDHDWEGVQDESGYGDTAGTAPVDEESDERE